AIQQKRKQGTAEPLKLTLTRDLANVRMVIFLSSEEPPPAQAAPVREAIRGTTTEANAIIEKVKALKPIVNATESRLTLGNLVDKAAQEKGDSSLTPIGWEASKKLNGRWRIVLRYKDHLQANQAAEWEYNSETDQVYPFDLQNAPRFWSASTTSS